LEQLAGIPTQPSILAAHSDPKLRHKSPDGSHTVRAFLNFAATALLSALALAPRIVAAQGGPPPLPPLGAPPIPASNPQTPAKIALGQALYWDEQLSITGTVACGTCHGFPSPSLITIRYWAFFVSGFGTGSIAQKRPASPRTISRKYSGFFPSALK